MDSDEVSFVLFAGNQVAVDHETCKKFGLIRGQDIDNKLFFATTLDQIRLCESKIINLATPEDFM
jgi:hypothetical protein